MKKLLAEGTPAESFVILGWKIDTRRGLVSLPEHKFLAWDAELQEVIESSSKPIKLKQLERVQGRDVNVATIVHGASHFLNRTYQAIARAREHRFARFTADEILDLHMKRHFLRAAFNGVDINAMTFREPDHMGRSDAFEGGIGGFDICSGRAWRLQIPSELIHRRSQNFLEFLACIVQLVLLIKESSWQRSDCFLSVGDNTSALRWLEKSNFKADDHQSAHSALARETALLMLDRGITNFTQWLPGKNNVVADALSRRHDLSDHELTEFLFDSYPKQMPHGFHIKALPDDVSSWTLYWLRLTSGKEESPPKLTLPLNDTGRIGSISCTCASSPTIPTSPVSHDTNGTSCLEPTLKKSGIKRGANLRKATINWLKVHAVPPSMVFVRPSAQLATGIPALTRMERLRSFYNANSAPIVTKTRQRSTKKPFPST
jgi:hypothetical protein